MYWQARVDDVDCREHLLLQLADSVHSFYRLTLHSNNKTEISFLNYFLDRKLNWCKSLLLEKNHPGAGSKGITSPNMFATVGTRISGGGSASLKKKHNTKTLNCQENAEN